MSCKQNNHTIISNQIIKETVEKSGSVGTFVHMWSNKKNSHVMKATLGVWQQMKGDL